MHSNRSKLILVIDDSADNCTLLETLFHAQGWNVYTASNGADALMLLSELTILPDLILLDIEMPVMNGAEFRSEQRRIERIKDIPVLLMSASTDDAEIEAIYPDGRLSKPLQISNLLHRVNSFL